jgi:carbon-monoxide dehydrogenase small subunit
VKPAPFEYHAPESAKEAVELLAELGEGAKLIAGGQSLVPMLALRLAALDHLVDIRRVAGLRGIEKRGDAAISRGSERSIPHGVSHPEHHPHPPRVWIGAGTTQASIERSGLVRAAVPLLALATPLIGHFQIRNRGTIGGSLAHAEAAAEYPAVAVALDARLETLSPRGQPRPRPGSPGPPSRTWTPLRLAAPRWPTWSRSRPTGTARPPTAGGSARPWWPPPLTGQSGRRAMADIEVTVNGRRRRATVEPRLTLADFLRERCQLTGTHLGCEHGVCGACTVLLLSPGEATPTECPIRSNIRTPGGTPDENASESGLPKGQAVRSCLVFAVQADGGEVTTIEGIARLSPGWCSAGADGASPRSSTGTARGDGELSSVQAAFREHHGLQCGFCTPGFVISVTAFLRDNPDPTDKQIREALSGNLCRCTGYRGILAAVRAAASSNPPSETR